jgi:mevalonate kinase
VCRVDAATRYEKTATLFRLNHALLNVLGVGHTALTLVYETSNKYNFACKLTGTHTPSIFYTQ